MAEAVVGQHGALRPASRTAGVDKQAWIEPFYSSHCSREIRIGDVARPFQEFRERTAEARIVTAERNRLLDAKTIIEQAADILAVIAAAKRGQVNYQARPGILHHIAQL